MPRSVGIIGYGQFGAFVHTLTAQFLPSCEVRVYSRRMGNGGDGPFTDLANAAQADVVVLCGSISEFPAQLQDVLEHVRPETVIVDVATVKEYTESVLHEHAPTQPYIATHPMFGPASYEKCDGSVEGFRLVVTGHTLPESQYRALQYWLRSCGLVVISMSAAEHDRYLAETLFLTHYIAQTVTKAAFVRTDIDTVSFGYLMDAVESVRADRSLFQDVFTHNPHCAAVIERYRAAAATIEEQLQAAKSSL